MRSYFYFADFFLFSHLRLERKKTAKAKESWAKIHEEKNRNLLNVPILNVNSIWTRKIFWLLRIGSRETHTERPRHSYKTYGGDEWARGYILLLFPGLSSLNFILLQSVVGLKLSFLLFHLGFAIFSSSPANDLLTVDGSTILSISPLAWRSFPWNLFWDFLLLRHSCMLLSLAPPMEISLLILFCYTAKKARLQTNL